ncbi:BQ5605_C002g01061 [Microbotryum silenes-dioicae]|uniref:BQ5605_C002g01061 protein n=1 Tax=Microbotryum silenes-dioicae TaxID=796604 RepID=A0A2X0M1J2_9BASI|nr:BQ5605_C002g01061 [Microbotryum silenes-dioicae]
MKITFLVLFAEPKAEARDTFSTRAEDDSKDSWRKKRSAE